MSGRGRRRRGHGGGGGGGGGHGGGDSRWLVTYADLLTLLMVLFLVLWVISTIDLKKFEKFKEGLGAFGNPASEQTVASPGGDEPPVEGELAGPGTADPEVETTTTSVAGPTTTVAAATDGEAPGTETPSTEAPINETPITAAPTPPTTLPHELEASEVQATADQVQAAIAAAGVPDVVTVAVSERGIVVRIAADDVLFDSGSADITAYGASVIGVVAPLLQGFTNRIMIEGHTDRRPLRRTGYDNWDLSVDRAVSVLHLLGDRFGVAPDRLGAAGYGDQRPVAEGDDPASLAKNRRVEIVVLAGPDT